ncbi:putative response regulatory protein [compost metagenome]
MYKLLIVDDEPTVRYGLSNYFDWSAYGIRVAGEADDGDVALEEVERLKPDLVFTDVRMPNLDGIRLSRQLRERYPHIKIVFVSGHDDADYLKSAMQINAVDYIFKPVNMQELRAVVERISAELQEEDRERRLTSAMQLKLRESIPLLREKFLHALILGQSPAINNIQERIDFLELNLPVEADYGILVMSVDNYTETFESRTERDRQLLTYAAINICQELIDRDMGGYAFETGSGEFVGLLRWKDDEGHEERLLALAGVIRESLEHWLHIGVTIGIGDRTKELRRVSDSYAQAREAAGHKWYLGKNRIITMDSLEPLDDQLVRIDHAQMEKLTTLIKAGDVEGLRREMDHVFGRLTRNRNSGVVYMRNLSLQIALLTDQLLLDLGVGAAGGEELPIWETLMKQETIEELRQTLELYTSDACVLIRERRSGKLRNLIERVQAIIEARYADNLTVADIGKEVYLTPTYVSLLYKQETGRTINDYVTQVRIKRAKELLHDPQNKFYDVCYAVGYADPSYFTKLFKKMTGVTPSAYRDQLM